MIRRFRADREERQARRLLSGSLGGRTEVAQRVPERPRAEKRAASGGDQLPGVVTGPDGQYFELAFDAGSPYGVDVDLASASGQSAVSFTANDIASSLNLRADGFNNQIILQVLDPSIASSAFLRLLTGSGILDLANDDDNGWICMTMYESATDVPAPDPSHGSIFFRDNGSGKTQLCVRFNTGAVQVLATQP